MNPVVAVDTLPLRLPMRGRLRWGGASELAEACVVLVRVRVADGAWGVAEAPVRPTIYGETPAGIEAAVREHVAPHLLGADLEDDSALATAVAALPFNLTARAAVEVATLTARAHARGASLAADWAGPRPRVRVSAILGLDAPEVVAREASWFLGEGVRVFKVKVGRDARQDDAVLAALADVLAGSDAILYADANEAYGVDEAPRRLERLAAAGVCWVEEPLPTHLLRARAALRREAVLPIIADDSCFTPRDLERELAHDTFDVLNVKPARSGVRASLQMLDRARAHGKGAMVGSQAGTGLGTALAAIVASHEAVDHPCELTFPLRLGQDTTTGPWRYVGGELDLDQVLPASLRPDLLRAFDDAPSPTGRPAS